MATGFVQNPKCPVQPCMRGGDFLYDHELRREVTVRSLRRAEVGQRIYFHRVLERLEDFDGEVVLIVEGDHDPVMLLPPKR